MNKLISAAKLHNYEWARKVQFGEYNDITDESRVLLNTLLECLKKIKATGNDGDVWEFWVSAPRGPIEDFGDYEELHDCGEYESYEEFEKSWKEWFPLETYWYNITVVSRNGFCAVAINNSTVISLKPDYNAPWKSLDYTLFLQFLLDELDSIIEMSSKANIWII